MGPWGWHCIAWIWKIFVCLWMPQSMLSLAEYLNFIQTPSVKAILLVLPISDMPLWLSTLPQRVGEWSKFKWLLPILWRLTQYSYIFSHSAPATYFDLFDPAHPIMKHCYCQILTTGLRRRGNCWWYDDDGDHCVEEEAVSGRRRHACFQPLRGRPCSYLVPTLVMFDQQEHCKLHLSTLHLSRQVAKTCHWLLLACAHQSRSTSTAL